MKKEDYVNSDVYYKYCRAYDYGDCPIYKNESSPGCYLTTACVLTMDRADDCAELTVLRTFRDTYLKAQDSGCRDIHEHYRWAPKIMAIINKLENCKEIYKEMYYSLVAPCVALIKAGHNKQAYELYKNSFLAMKKTYIQKNEEERRDD